MCPGLVFVAFIVGVFVGIPTVCGIAILRHGLWDLDVVVQKTVQYGLLVAGFMIVVGVVILLAPLALIGVGGSVDPPTIAIGVLLAIGFTRRPVPSTPMGEPGRVRQASDAVRGALRVRGACRRDVLDRRRAAADGAAPR